jgi:hypothetical protein
MFDRKYRSVFPFPDAGGLSDSSQFDEPIQRVQPRRALTCFPMTGDQCLERKPLFLQRTHGRPHRRIHRFGQRCLKGLQREGVSGMAAKSDRLAGVEQHRRVPVPKLIQYASTTNAPSTLAAVKAAFVDACSAAKPVGRATAGFGHTLPSAASGNLGQ